jgi:hypothetical protein
VPASTHTPPLAWSCTDARLALVSDVDGLLARGEEGFLTAAAQELQHWCSSAVEGREVGERCFAPKQVQPEGGRTRRAHCQNPRCGAHKQPWKLCWNTR